MCPRGLGLSTDVCRVAGFRGGEVDGGFEGVAVEGDPRVGLCV